MTLEEIKKHNAEIEAEQKLITKMIADKEEKTKSLNIEMLALRERYYLIQDCYIDEREVCKE